MNLQNQVQLRYIRGDGNCLFSAIAFGYHLSMGTVLNDNDLAQWAKFYRRKAVASICTPNGRIRPKYAGFVESCQSPTYCKNMAKDGFYGGELEISALSKALRIPIYVYSNTGTPRLISFYGIDYLPKQPIYLAYSGPTHEHYDVFVPQ